MSRNWRGAEHVDDRNYAVEARNLINGLKGSQIYEMYGIVTSQLKKRHSDTREKELKAVKTAIETQPHIDKHRLKHIVNGYQSEMARTGRPKDGQKTPYRKKS
jgi:hypothetical protein|tara:strand:+ start:491 stop:799 length:309 start_codon:yes stop_codon:yes gene_type:complete